jgi:hypothetical protein
MIDRHPYPTRRRALWRDLMASSVIVALALAIGYALAS